jgi:hypothetical protein
MTATGPDRLRWAEEYLDTLTGTLAGVQADLLELGAQHAEAAQAFLVSAHPAHARARLLLDAQRRHQHAKHVMLPRARRNHWAAVERRDRIAAAASATR